MANSFSGSGTKLSAETGERHSPDRPPIIVLLQVPCSSALDLLIVLPWLADPQAAAKTWCVAKPSTGEAALRANLEFACSESDCSAIQGTGGCSAQNGGVLLSRASVAMNAYYQARGRNSWNCFFNATGIITITDPSKHRSRISSHAAVSQICCVVLI